MGRGCFGGYRVAVNRGSIGHSRLDGRRFGRGFYAYGAAYGWDLDCDLDYSLPGCNEYWYG
jgi:hypothetical protein